MLVMVRERQRGSEAILRPLTLEVFKLLLLAWLYIKDALVAIWQEWSKCCTFSSVSISFTLLCTLSQINSDFISTSTVHLTPICSHAFDKPCCGNLWSPVSARIKNWTGLSLDGSLFGSPWPARMSRAWVLTFNCHCWLGTQCSGLITEWFPCVKPLLPTAPSWVKCRGHISSLVIVTISRKL